MDRKGSEDEAKQAYGGLHSIHRQCGTWTDEKNAISQLLDAEVGGAEEKTSTRKVL